MEFNTLEEVLSHFNLDNDDKETIQKKLKKIRNKLHPDKTEGSFESEEDKQMFLTLQNAIKFLGKKDSKELTLHKANSEIAEILKDFTKSKKIHQSLESVKQKTLNLENILDYNVKTFQRKTKVPKITAVAVTTVITALWLFPNIVKDHPILSVICKFNAEFSLLWLATLIISCYLWLKIKSIESTEDDIMRSYKMESTQNKMFALFIKWIHHDHNKYEFKKDHSGRYFNFTSDDLTNFLVNRYDLFQVYLKRNSLNTDSWDFIKKLRDDEEHGYFEDLQKRNRNVFSNFNQFIPKPGEISLEIAQMLTELIIQRLLSKEIIKISDKKNLSETYIFET